MVRVRSTDKTVVAYVEGAPKVFDGGDDIVHILLRRHALFFGFPLYFLTVLVRTGQEHHVEPARTLVARHGVGRDSRV